MRKFLCLAALAITVLSFNSCTTEKDDTPDWGVADAFDDFLFKKYEPDTLTRTIVFKRNADSKKDSTTRNSSIVLRLVRSSLDSLDNMIPVLESDAQLFIDGQPAKNNTFKVAPETERLKIGILLSKEMTAKEDHTYRFYLEMDNPGYERVNEMTVDKGKVYLSGLKTMLKIKVKHHANILKVIVTMALIILAALLLLWLTIFKYIFFRSVHYDSMQIIYMDGETRKGAPSQIDISGARKIIFSDNPPAQSFLNRIFTRKIVTETNSFWEKEAIATPGTEESLDFTETISDDMNTIYTSKGVILDTNGPRRPFEVKKKGSNVRALISIQ